ncbi:protein MAK16 homolog [Brassica napus]|uniref:protein MAK16 homolog n=1 Tax=Brassica napus TaxID=3708 RepID=UPI002078B357|nr:protein MAK16 homolog [Brassica napus]
MQKDEAIWHNIKYIHCCYMAKTETGIFCRNPYNVTSICSQSSCPLANSRYATIRDHDGVFYLYTKTIERAHTPKHLWERIKLPRNYEKALELIDKHLLYWPEMLQHMVKQRLTKLNQMRIRMRILALETREKIMRMPMPRREIKREARREEKTGIAAVFDNAIETKLLERLKNDVYYPDILNYLENNVQAEEEEEEEEEEPEIEYVEGYGELEKEEEDMEDFYGFLFKESHLDGDDHGSEDEDGDDAAEQVVIHRKGRALRNIDDDNGKSKKKPKVVVVEVEQEDGDTSRGVPTVY